MSRIAAYELVGGRGGRERRARFGESLRVAAALGEHVREVVARGRMLRRALEQAAVVSRGGARGRLTPSSWPAAANSTSSSFGQRSSAAR